MPGVDTAGPAALVEIFEQWNHHATRRVQRLPGLARRERLIELGKFTHCSGGRIREKHHAVMQTQDPAGTFRGGEFPTTETEAREFVSVRRSKRLGGETALQFRDRGFGCPKVVAIGCADAPVGLLKLGIGEDGIQQCVVGKAEEAPCRSAGDTVCQRISLMNCVDRANQTISPEFEGWFMHPPAADHPDGARKISSRVAELAEMLLPNHLPSGHLGEEVARRQFVQCTRSARAVAPTP